MLSDADLVGTWKRRRCVGREIGGAPHVLTSCDSYAKTGTPPRPFEAATTTEPQCNFPQTLDDVIETKSRSWMTPYGFSGSRYWPCLRCCFSLLLPSSARIILSQTIWPTSWNFLVSAYASKAQSLKSLFTHPPSNSQAVNRIHDRGHAHSTLQGS